MRAIKCLFNLIAFIYRVPLSLWVIWTCCIQHDRGRVAWIKRFTTFVDGVGEIENCESNSPWFAAELLRKWKHTSCTAANGGRKLSPFGASFVIKGWMCPRHKPTLVLSHFVNWCTVEWTLGGAFCYQSLDDRTFTAQNRHRLSLLSSSLLGYNRDELSPSKQLE